MRHAIREADIAQRGERDLAALIESHAGVNQRQLDIPQRTRSREEIEGLKDEADLAIADLGEFVVVHLADAVPVQFIRAGGRRIEAAEHIHQRRFSRARRPHDRDVFATLDAEGNAAQRMHGLAAHFVMAADGVETNEAHGFNVQRPTSNVEHPTSNAAAPARRWMSSVRC